MFRRLFQASPADFEIIHHEEAPEILVENSRKPQSREGEDTAKNTVSTELGKFDSFDEIYRSGPANQTNLPYDILKVAQMLESPFIANMSVESKRGSLMMALEAANTEPKDILLDAMVRQRALNEYEESQQRKLSDFESLKGDENRVIQEELDNLNAEHVTRIQANVHQVAKQQDALRAWQTTKHQQLALMAEACAYLAPIESTGNNLAAALDRAARR